MYRCEVCDRVTESGTPSNRIVIETRPTEYPHREKVHWHPPTDRGQGKWVDDPGGVGTEVVREIRMCPECAAKARTLERDPTS